MLQLDPAIIGRFPNIVVVMHEEVEQRTAMGYTLLAICEEQKVERPFDRYGQRPSDEAARVLTTALFVMGRSEESAVGELAERLVNANKQIEEHRNNTATATRAQRTAESDLATTKSKLTAADAEVMSLRSQRDTRDDRIRKMENDLGMLRAAFGSKACDEALGVRP